MIARRTALQLTPLLDLLLIVIFAQYLDVGERDRKRIGVVESLAEQSRAAAETAMIARESAAQYQLQATQALQIANNARAELATTRAELERVRRSELAVSEAAAELFQVSPETLNAALSPFTTPSMDVTADERAEIRQRLSQITSGNADAVVFHLLTHEELRKRVDIWRLHLSGNNLATFEAGDRTQTFRVDPAAFLTDLGRLADTLPDPKRLVVVLFTYEEASRLITIEAIRDRLPQLMARLAQNSDSRFDYADLGFGRLETRIEEPLPSN